MKNIKLKRLELTNYRNIEHAIYEFNGNSKIVGDNRIGKTNTLESIYWLLTGYLLNGSSDIAQIKPIKDTRAVVIVKGTFDIDGKEISICKKYGEEWVKQRNTGVEVLKGHFCELYYNDVKQSSNKDYDLLFKEDFGLNCEFVSKLSLVQMLCNPFYLGDLCDNGEWKEVRQLIISLVGDITDEDVFKAEPTTEILRSELALTNGRIDQVKLRLLNNIKSLKETLLADEAKIEMLEKTEKPADELVEFAKNKLVEIDKEIANLNSGAGNSTLIAECKSKQAEIKGEIADIKANTKPNENKALIDLKNSENRLLADKTNFQFAIGRLQRELDDKKTQLKRAEFEKDSLLNDYKELKAQEIVIDTICPVCKRPLEQSQITEAKKNAEESKQSKLDLIIIDGKKQNALIEAIKTDVSNKENQIAEQEKLLDETNKQLESVQIQIDELDKPTENVIDPRIVEFEKELAELDNKIVELATDEEKARQANAQAVYDLEQSKAEHKKVIADLDYYERQQKELHNCKIEQKEHNKQLVMNEQMKEAVDKFMFVKLNLLDKNVSKVFGNIRFQLISENLNGGFDTVCKPYIYDVLTKTSTNILWKSGSKSERVATGIAIVECIKMALGVSDMPYLFDEGGEISTETMKTRLQTESQIICVKVQDDVKTPIVMSI